MLNAVLLFVSLLGLGVTQKSKRVVDGSTALVQSIGGVGVGGCISPDRGWPSGVMCVTCNMVDVELGDEITQGCDVDFVGFEVGGHPAGDLAGFMDKLGLLVGVEFKNFT